MSLSSVASDPIPVAQRASTTRAVLICVFALSGFSGLIYENIWTHYLKMFLGHAAYAQTLVLGIFMGGMAIGAWLSAKYVTRLGNALQAYAITEGIIGLLGLCFHSLFEWSQGFAYSTILPALESPTAIFLFKWGFSACLILPQSICLGMTFPLMSASLIRKDASASGETIAILYFTNSLGAVFGVLVSGFWLVEEVGLPGTILTAALLNVFVAIVTWFAARSEDNRGTAPKQVHAQTDLQNDSLAWVLLSVACFTGVASFIYEISWIRMLNLVLGSSTHSFELMLSAFILGLALGGLWIKRRMGGAVNTVKILAMVQVVMGLSALATTVLYPSMFGIMQAVVASLAKTDGGYWLYNVIGYLLSLGVMFPATFCAGMTLPLLTHALIEHRYGEESVGHVYAVNTVGAIIGVFAATHVGLPLLGLKGLVTTGAIIDMTLGLVLLWYVRKPAWSELLTGVAATVALCIGVALFVAKWNYLDMASGVYRAGILMSPDMESIVFHKDGKTATVDLVKTMSGRLSIRTNGKSDAAIQMENRVKPSRDENTMILAAAFPLSLHPEAKVVANIGFGSGLTSQVLLGSSTIERVDTVEIEPAMVEAANGFRPRVEAVYSDPRSHIHIEDARTFFSTHKTMYDVIISEPSNPWVSGVASLFTDEFYQTIRTHLKPEGLLVQWMQLYEIDPSLVFSVLQAVARNFDRYALYSTVDGSELMIVATAEGNVTRLSGQIFQFPAIKAELGAFAISSVEDLALMRVVDRETMVPLLDSLDVPVNSEYFPFLDLHAARTRFLQHNATELVTMVKAPVPFLEMIEHKPLPFDAVVQDSQKKPFRAGMTVQAVQTQQYLLHRGDSEKARPMPPALRDLALIRLQLFKCDGAGGSEEWFEALMTAGGTVNVYQTSTEASRFWEGIQQAPCFARITDEQKKWIALFRAVGARDAGPMLTLAEQLFQQKAGRTEGQKSYLMMAAMTGALALHDRPRAAQVWHEQSRSVFRGQQPGLAFQLLAAHSQLDRAEPVRAASNK